MHVIFTYIHNYCSYLKIWSAHTSLFWFLTLILCQTPHEHCDAWRCLRPAIFCWAAATAKQLASDTTGWASSASTEGASACSWSHPITLATNQQHTNSSLCVVSMNCTKIIEYMLKISVFHGVILLFPYVHLHWMHIYTDFHMENPITFIHNNCSIDCVFTTLDLLAHAHAIAHAIAHAFSSLLAGWHAYCSILVCKITLISSIYL